MTDPRLERFADLLVGYCTDVRPGDVVALNLDTAAMPLIRPLTRAVFAAGGEPLLRLSYPEFVADRAELVSDAVLAAEPTVDLAEIRATDAWIRVRAPQNTRQLEGADMERLARWRRRQTPVRRHRIDATRWVGALFPTPALAQDAGMTLDAYEAFVFGAMHLDEDDPSAAWRRLAARQDELIERLSEADEVRILAEGTDLRLRTGGRTWKNSDGKRNMPSGEVFTSPHEASATGVIRFGIPSLVRGHLVEDVTLRFEDGEVVDAHAATGNAYLQRELATDEGARRLGEIGIGTNRRIQRPTKQILFDEKIGGTVHLALGRSYRETGGRNESEIHWDLISDLRSGGEIHLDGAPFQRDGRFLV